MPTPRKYSSDTDYLQGVFDEALEEEQSRLGGPDTQTLEDRSQWSANDIASATAQPTSDGRRVEDPRAFAQPLTALARRPQYPREAPPGMSLRAPSKEATGERPAVPLEAPPGMGSAFYGRAARLARDDGDEGGAARYAVRAAEDDQQNTGHPAPQLPPVSPFAALAQAPRQRAQSMYGGLGAPPERQAPSQAGNALALVFDALANRGRNSGRIISRLATPQDSEYENYQRRVQAAKDAASIEALGRRGLPREADPETMELRRRGLELRERGMGTTEDREARIAGESERKRRYEEDNRTVGSDAHKRVLAETYETFPQLRGQLDGFTVEEMTKTPAAKAAVQRELERQRTGMQGREFDRRQGVQDSYAQGREGRANSEFDRRQVVSDEIDAGKETRKEEREIAKASAEIPGFRIVNEDAYVAAMRDPTTRKKAEDAAGAYSVMNENLRKMRELRAKHGGEIPGEFQAEYDGYKTLAIGSVTTIAQTGVLNGSEYERYSTMIPETGLRAWDFTNLFGKDIRGEQLEGVARALAGSVDSGLRKWGVVYESPEDEATRRASQPKPRAPKRAASPRTAKPKPRDYDDDDLGVVYE